MRDHYILSSSSTSSTTLCCATFIIDLIPGLSTQKKQPEVDKILTFIMAGNHPEWFNTPILKYLSMKKEFLGDFQGNKHWGELGTQKQVIALSTLLEYLKKTRDLADQFPQLKDEIILHNKNLILERAVPIPDKLYEHLLLAVVEGADKEYQTIWEQPSCVTLVKIEKFLEKRRTSSLALFQSKAWSDIHCHQYSSHEEPCDDNKEASEDNSIDEGKREMTKAKADLRSLRN